jgi:predicted GH43/DUF377 family glycosyl hydrolase
MNYALFYIVVFLAFAVSGLFVWGALQILRITQIKRKRFEEARQLFSLKRHPGNPLLHPSQYDFEGQAVMNPAAIHDGERTHLFYRAIGNDGVSRIGYASSGDGINFDDRLPYPVFALEGPDPHLAALRRSYAEKNYPALVASGGSWGGTEDPRAVVIDDRMYLSFSAFHNWDSVRIGVTSIAMSDVKEKKWKWTAPTFLSGRNEVHKNWVIFPEKIKNKFAVLHNLYGDTPNNVRVDYLDSLHRDPTEYIKSPYSRRTTPYVWDSTPRGVGPPPIKTPKGWLIFYHATSQSEPHKYKLGAMLLDLLDITKVIARGPAPVLEPNAHYESNGAKPGIVYASGATVHDDKLTLYYGAADNFVCAASTSLSEFVHRLTVPKPQFITTL